MSASKPATHNLPPRLLERFRKEHIPSLSKELGLKNVMSVPHLEKIVLNIGCGEAINDAKILESAQNILKLVSGQKPSITRAKQAISNFKIKQGDAVGCKVTLRRARMYEYLDRLISIVLPRIRDFRGLSLRGFDQGGNYSFGLSDLLVYPELSFDQIPQALGMDITIVTSSRDRDQAYALLKSFGFPLMKPADKESN